MMTTDELFDQVNQLPLTEKWRLVKQLLRSLENAQAETEPPMDWHDFLQATYGAFRDTPIQRWDPGEYEERETIE